MDGANWRPTQGADPAAVTGVDPNAAASAGGDWRAQLQPEARTRIVNKIMETLKKHLPVSVPEGLSELQKIATRFEEKIYTAATSQSDYLRKISLKMLTMESQTKTQQNPGNAQVIPSQTPPGADLRSICNTKMDHELASMYGLLERIHDGNEEPTNLPLRLLRAITNDFSGNQLIGIGGFAKVYKGKLWKRTVAVKRLSNYPILDEKYFNEEVHCLMRLKHKNIVRLLGFCANSQRQIVNYDGKDVMATIQDRLLCFEYVRNGSLNEHITDASQGLEWSKRYQIIKGICHGLHYLHEQNIVHLDLKPQNVLLDHNLAPKISDFGLSRRFNENQSRDMLTKPMGTLGYCAPEMLDRVITKKSDIYSLGVTIMEILIGEKSSTVEYVLESWNNRLKASLKQKQQEEIRVCAEVAISCIHFDPEGRPGVQDIIQTLNVTESMEMSIEIGMSTSLVTTYCSDTDSENRPAIRDTIIMIGETENMECSIEIGLDTSLVTHVVATSTERQKQRNIMSIQTHNLSNGTDMEYAVVLDAQLSEFFSKKAPLSNVVLVLYFVCVMYDKHTGLTWKNIMIVISLAMSIYQNIVGVSDRHPGAHGLPAVRLCMKMECLSNVLRMLAATSMLMFTDNDHKIIMMAVWFFLILILPYLASFCFNMFYGRILTEGGQTEQWFGYIKATQCHEMINKAKAKVQFDLAYLVVYIHALDSTRDWTNETYVSPFLFTMLPILVPPAAVTPFFRIVMSHQIAVSFSFCAMPQCFAYYYLGTPKGPSWNEIIVLSVFSTIIMELLWGIMRKQMLKDQSEQERSVQEGMALFLSFAMLVIILPIMFTTMEDVNFWEIMMWWTSFIVFFMGYIPTGCATISTKAWKILWIYSVIVYIDIQALVFEGFVHPYVMISDIYALLLAIRHIGIPIICLTIK